MTIELSKGSRINLEKEAPGLENIHLGLGWDTKKADGAEFDLDACVLMLGENDKAIGSGGFIFYNSKTSACGSVVHQGDNLTGEGEGDDEIITVELSKIPENVQKLLVAVTVHDAEERNQNFGLVENAFIRIADKANDNDIARYDLTEDYSSETSLVFAEIYRKDGQWRAVAKGDGFKGGLTSFLSTYGL